MAGSIIDELVVTLGLDASQFKSQQKEALDKLHDFEKKSKESGKKIADQNKAAQDAVLSLGKTVVGLAGITLSAAAAKQFIDKVQAGLMGLGTLSATTGLSTSELYKFGNVIARVGGSADEARQSIGGIQKEWEKFRYDPAAAANLRRLMNDLGVDPRAKTGGFKNAIQLFDELTAARERSNMSAGEFRGRMQDAGFNEHMIQAALQGSAAFRKAMEMQERFAKTMSEDVGAAQERHKVFTEIETSINNLVRIFLSSVQPMLLGFVKTAEEVVVLADSIAQLSLPEWLKKAISMTADFLIPGWKALKDAGAAANDEADKNEDPSIPNKAKPRSYERGSNAQPPAAVTGVKTTGSASFYGEDHRGSKTSTGSTYNPDEWTVAIRQRDRALAGGVNYKSGPAWADIYNPATGKIARVKITDVMGSKDPQDRNVDLSTRTFRYLNNGSTTKGVLPNVEVRILPKSPDDKPYMQGPVENQAPTAGGKSQGVEDWPEGVKPGGIGKTSGIELGDPNITAYNSYRYTRGGGPRNRPEINNSTSEVQVADVDVLVEPTNAFGQTSPFAGPYPFSASQTKQSAALSDYGLA